MTATIYFPREWDREECTSWFRQHMTQFGYNSWFLTVDWQGEHWKGAMYP